MSLEHHTHQSLLIIIIIENLQTTDSIQYELKLRLLESVFLENRVHQIAATTVGMNVNALHISKES